MKIAYYEENNFHTEIFGTFFNNFENYDITIYNTEDKSQWIEYYETIYNFKRRPSNALINEYDLYNKIIIGTSTNTSEFLDKLDTSSKNIILNKIIYICHLNEDLKLFPDINTIVLTPLNKTSNNNYILPINNFYNIILRKKNPIFGIIGRFKNNNRNHQDIINIIKKYNTHSFCFYIFARTSKFISADLFELKKSYPDHIKIFLNKNTEYIVNQFKKIKYLFQPNIEDTLYYKDRLTGLIPLSYNFNIPIITTKKLADIYNIDSAFTYNNNIDEIFKTILNMSPKIYDEKLKKLLIEKETIIKNNKKILFNLYNS